MKIVIPIIVLFLASCAGTKHLPLTEEQLKSNLKTHIVTLADDAMEGRETGEAGEKKAAGYIEKAFKKNGLKGKGNKGFRQEFAFTSGAEYGPSTQLLVNSTFYNAGEDFIPLPYSSNGVVTGYIARIGYGISDSALARDDYRGKLNISKKILVIETGTPGGNDPHGKWGEWTDLRKKIDVAVAKGAIGIIFINSDTALDDPSPSWKNHISPSTIPVLFAKGKAATVLRDSVVTNCTAGAEIIRIEKKGDNVIGFIDNKAAHTVVIGAHYDHLGYGDGGSLHRGEKAIHNGADDNASGTAALIELAGFVKSHGLKKNNYLFIAFSGEEKGLLGSNHFVKNPTVDLSSISYMINMDMLGRLKAEVKTLIINGTGTSSRWRGIIDSTKGPDLKIKETEAGIGPSDHTSFYLKDIPVLHFFSGTHPDYHKPSDDEHLINYNGQVMIVKMIERILASLDGAGKLPFTKTSNENSEETPRFKVTLGVVPDYTFEGEGMRIDGVTDGKPAAKAGLMPGDVVVQLGEHKVHDMMSYMKALGKFSKGNTTNVKVMRGGAVVEKEITF